MLSVRRKTPSTELEYRARQRLMPTVFTGLSWTCPHKPIPQAQDVFEGSLCVPILPAPSCAVPHKWLLFYP